MPTDLSNPSLREALTLLAETADKARVAGGDARHTGRTILAELVSAADHVRHAADPDTWPELAPPTSTRPDAEVPPFLRQPSEGVRMVLPTLPASDPIDGQADAARALREQGEREAAIARRCPDGGNCHDRGCSPDDCFRVRSCGALSGYNDGRWTDEDVEQFGTDAQREARRAGTGVWVLTEPEASGCARLIDPHGGTFAVVLPAALGDDVGVDELRWQLARGAAAALQPIDPPRPALDEETADLLYLALHGARETVCRLETQAAARRGTAATVLDGWDVATTVARIDHLGSLLVPGAWSNDADTYRREEFARLGLPPIPGDEPDEDDEDDEAVWDPHSDEAKPNTTVTVDPEWRCLGEGVDGVAECSPDDQVHRGCGWWPHAPADASVVTNERQASEPDAGQCEDPAWIGEAIAAVGDAMAQPLPLHDRDAAAAQVLASLNAAGFVLHRNGLRPGRSNGEPDHLDLLLVDPVLLAVERALALLRLLPPGWVGTEEDELATASVHLRAVLRPVEGHLADVMGPPPAGRS